MSRQDTPRRVWVIARAVLGVAGVALGVGVLGRSVGDNSDASVAQIDTGIADAEREEEQPRGSSSHMPSQDHGSTAAGHPRSAARLDSPGTTR